MTAQAESVGFVEIARRLARRVDEALEKYTQYPDDCPHELAEAIRHSLLAPAKRMRPMPSAERAVATTPPWRFLPHARWSSSTLTR